LTRSNQFWRAAIHFSFPKTTTKGDATATMAEHEETMVSAGRDDNAVVAPSGLETDSSVKKVSAAEVDGVSVGNEENRQTACAADAAASPKKNDGPNNNNAAAAVAATGPSANNNPLKRPVGSILNEAGIEENTHPADWDAASSVPMDEDDGDDDTAKQQPPPPLAPEEPPPVDITKPVKRARTAYLIFADDKRGEVQEKVSYIVRRLERV
jgi:hypothetical protein